MLNKINSSLIGYSILIVLFLFIIFIPLLTDIDPNKQNLMNALADFNFSNLLGTDQYGRDMLTRLAHATRLSFILAFITMLTAAIPGILLGIFAAYKEGIIEKILILISDIILSLPGLLLVLLLVAFDP
ncbi:MAG: hypothetical protein ACPLSX_03090, partial [Arcobacter sp.]